MSEKPHKRWRDIQNRNMVWMVGLLLLFGLGARADAQKTIAFVSGGVVNPNIVLPEYQNTGSEVGRIDTDHLSFRYGAEGLVFETHNTGTLTVRANMERGGSYKYSVDGGALTPLTAAGLADYAISLPNSRDHLVKIIAVEGGLWTDYYSCTMDTGGSLSSSIFTTLPDGTVGYGPAACQSDVLFGPTTFQPWLDMGGGSWRKTPNSFIDHTSLPAQNDSSIRFCARGGSVWLCLCRDDCPLVFVPRVDGMDYAPVTIRAESGGNLFQWIRVFDNSTVTGFNASTMHEVVLSVCAFRSSQLRLGGVMVGGSGAALQKTAIAKRRLWACMGDSITVGNAFPAHGLYSNSNWPYLLGKAAGVSMANLGVGGMMVTPSYYPATGYAGSGSNTATGVQSMTYRTNHTGAVTLLSLDTVPDWFLAFAGTNDLVYSLNGRQIPLHNTDAPSVANNTLPMWTATGGNAGGTTVTTNAAFVTANLGQMVTGVTGANAGRVGFITAVTGSSPATLTIEPQGSTPWAQVQSGDTFATKGVAFYDQYLRWCRLLLDNPTYRSTKLMICNLLPRPVPVASQGNGSTPSQLRDYNAAIYAAYGALKALYPGRVYFADLSTCINSMTQTFDGLHPNVSGAQAVLHVIQAALPIKR